MNNIETLQKKAAEYFSNKDYKKSLEYEQKLYQLMLKDFGLEHHETIKVLYSMAVNHFCLDNYEDALIYYKKTFELSQKIFGQKHPDTICALFSLAECYHSLGQYEVSLTYSKKVLALSKETLGTKHPDTINTLSVVAQNYNSLGRYEDALNYGLEALKLYETTFKPEHPDTILNLGLVSEYYASLGKYKDALTYSKKALALSQKTFGSKHPDTIKALGAVAQYYNSLEQYEEVLTLASALESYKPNIKTIEPFDLYDISRVYCELEQTNEAITYGQEALKLFRKMFGIKHPDTINTLSEVAFYYHLLNKPKEALSYGNKALKLSLKFLGIKHPDTIFLLERLAFIYLFAGIDCKNKLEKTAKLNQSKAYFYKYINKQEMLCQSFANEDTKKKFFININSKYYILANLLLYTKASKEAFAVVEKGKARILLEKITEKLADSLAILEKEDAEQLITLKRKIMNYQKTIDKNQLFSIKNRLTKILQIKENIYHAKIEYGNLRKKLMLKNKKYKELNEIKTVNFTTGCTYLNENEIFISYCKMPILKDLSNNEYTIFVIKNKKLFVHKIKTANEIEKSVRSYLALLRYHEDTYLWQLSNGEYMLTQEREDYLLDEDAILVNKNEATNLIKKELKRLSQELSSFLLDPIANHLQEKPIWIISPDNILSFLPFETLELKGKAILQKENQQYTIKYIQSLSIYALLKEREKSHALLYKRKKILLMGDANYDSESLETSKNKQNKEQTTEIDKIMHSSELTEDKLKRAFSIVERRFTPLKYSSREIDDIAEIFKEEQPAVFKKEAATKQQLETLNKEQELKNYQYLLFSAHGYFNENIPELSALILGKEDKQEKFTEKQYVTINNWSSFDLNSDLTVLSACETGIGKIVNGLGVFGLPYALYVAGNKNTLLTLWQVEDKSTAEFMKRFFSKIKEGQAQAEALSQTKREFIQEGYETKQWAPFILYGV